MATSSPSPTLKPRTRPMEVLVLGLCRTGTVSISTALEQLGFEKGSIYHAANVFRTPGHADKWLKALKAKYESQGRPFGREEWDDLLGECSALTDIPAACFATELIEAYPEAKVILTTRSPESWVSSMNETIWASQRDPMRPWERLFYSEHLESIAKLFDYVFEAYFYGGFDRYAKRVFGEHNERVRMAALASRGKGGYLEFQARDGWSPLCAFLEREVLETEYPRSNDRDSWRKMFKTGERWNKVKRVGGLTLGVVMVVIAIGLGWRRGVDRPDRV